MDPGINDNGSGVAVLLEAADALGAHPKRRTRFAFWAAEELGLVGSRHYVRTLAPERRDEIAAYLNLDMVGSPNAVPSVYSDGDQRLARLLRTAHPGREPGFVPAAAATTPRSRMPGSGWAVSTPARRSAAPAGGPATRATTCPAIRPRMWTGACCCAWRGPRSSRYAK